MFDIDQLAALPIADLDARLTECRSRLDARFTAAYNAGRDLTADEAEQTANDRDTVTALAAARALRSDNDERGQRIGRAISEAVEMRSAGWQPTLLVSDRHLREHAEALREGRPFGAVEVESRARVTAASDLGSPGAWHPGAPNEPRHLIAFSGIPVSPLTGRSAEVPSYTGPSAAAGVDEGTNHGEFDAVAPVSLTALRYGRWSDVSALANAVDDLTALNVMHSWGIARDLDAMAVAAIEDASQSLGVSGGEVELAAREAVLLVAAQTYSAETDLVIVGTPAALAELVGTSPTNAGDLSSTPVRFNGARIYPTTEASPTVLTVFAPSAFRCFQSPLQSASLIDPSSGAHKFGSWTHSTGIAEQIAGAGAVMVGAS